MFHVAGTDGHFFPMVPLAAGLVAAGHDVVFAIDAEYCDVVRDHGFSAVAVCPPRRMTSPEVIAASNALDGLDRLRYQLEGFLENAQSNSGELITYARDYRPDVFVRESSGWGAWLAGELLDLPVATFDYSPTRPGFFAETVGDLFSTARAGVGLPPDPALESLHTWLTLVGAPPGWFPPACFRPTTHLLQPPPDPGVGEAAPGWLDAFGERPTVYVTLGTVFNRTPGVLDAVLEAVEGLDVNAIVTVGKDVDPSQYSTASHVHVESFVPQGVVLDRCDLVVAHGGYGSLMGALRRGLPVVAIPLAAGDNQLNAARVEKLGAGVSIPEGGRSPERIQSAIELVLGTATYSAAARRLADGMATLPPFAESVRLVERLAHERRPIVADVAG